jgi:chromosomal replication initiation ATPase DnaA
MTLESIIEAIKYVTHIDIHNEKSRHRDVVDARKMYGYIAKNYTLLTYQAIGDSIGKNHATIMHYNKETNDLCETDKTFKRKFDRVLNILKKGKKQNFTREEVIELLQYLKLRN